MSLKCDTCGKEMKNKDNGKNSFIGASFRVNADPPADSEQIEYIKEQMRPYEPNHTYSICWSCYLKAMGIPLPAKF